MIASTRRDHSAAEAELLPPFRSSVVWWAVVFSLTAELAIAVKHPRIGDHITRRLSADTEAFTVTLQMPNVTSNKKDRMVCHAYKVDREVSYILSYQPLVSEKTAHHLLIYGCSRPGSSKGTWHCSHVLDQSGLEAACSGPRQIVYAWALGAPGMTLPDGVGFRIGELTGIQYLILQVHYKGRFTAGKPDNSGVILHMTQTPQKHQAGYYILGNYGFIPPQQSEFYAESGCLYNDSYPVYPISYRVHSHELGLVTSAYRIRNKDWLEIGRMSPQLPEAFYNITYPGLEIRAGDLLVARCTMNSMDRSEKTPIGSTHHDEMCNFYILYHTYYQGDITLKFCFRDAQTFHWADHVSDIPWLASSLDGVAGVSEVKRKFELSD